jgi:hypothetical protein
MCSCLCLGSQTSVNIKTTVVWVVTPCSLIHRCKIFGGIFCLHIHEKHFYPEYTDTRRLRKHLYLSTKLHCVTSQQIRNCEVPWRLPHNSSSSGSIPGQDLWDLWWTKWYWGRFSPNTSVSPANSHSTKYSIFINLLWLIQVRTMWAQYQPIHAIEEKSRG